MKYFVPYIKPYRKACILGPLSKFMEAILELLLPTLMAYMINEGIVNRQFSVVTGLGILMILMVFVGFGFSCICQYYAAKASQGFGTALRKALLKKILHLSAQDLSQFDTSTLFQRLGSDVNQLQLALAMMIRLVIRAPFLIIGAIVMAFLLDHTLAWILCACVPFIALLLYLFFRFSTPLYRTYQKMLDQFLTKVGQYCTSITTIRVFVQQKKETLALQEESASLQKQMQRIASITSCLQPFSALIINVVIVALLYQGVLSLSSTSISAGTLVAFMNYANQILLALIAVSNLIVLFTKAAASKKRVEEILALPTVLRTSGSQSKDLDGTSISAKHLSFQYPNASKPCLQDLTFTIHENEMIGVVGGTGDGKSTLLKLIAQVFPTTIAYAARPFEVYHKDAQRALISYIPQKASLFQGSVKENLLYGNPDASSEQCIDALKKAQIYDFVEANGGLDMYIEASGKNLSGGQKQRLALAKGFLKPASIYLFDDVCSALDFQSEQRILQEINRMKDATRILVSQRVHSLRYCDRIMVLHHGKILAFDTHENLLQNCSFYQEIYHTQKEMLS